MEQKKMGIGIIGCGKIAQTRHIPEYAQNPNAELIGYYDFIYERAEEMAKIYGGRVFSTVEELLNSAEIDAVSVCTANNASVYGTKGILKISCKTHSIEVLFENGDRMLYELPCQEVSGIIDTFVDCLVCDTEPLIDGKQVFHAMRAFFAAVESAQDAKQMVPNEKIKA